MLGYRSLPALVLAALVGTTAHAAPSPPPLPTAALEAELDRERAAGSTRSEPLADALLHVAARAPTERRARLLDLASQVDPTLAGPHLARAREALRHADMPGAGAALVAAAHAARLDAREEAMWVRRGMRTAHAWLAAMLATLTTLFALRTAPLAWHSLGKRFGSRIVATLLLVSAPAGAFAASTALGVLATAAVVGLFLRRRERVCLAVVCVLLAAVEIGAQACRARVMLLDPTGDTARMAWLAAGGSDPELEAAWAASPSRSAAQEFLLGLQARRSGDLAGARTRYLACLERDSKFAPAYVNLANLFFRAGAYDRAATGYRSAALFAPTDPIPRYDLAQTYIRMTHYAEADGELAAAAERGMAAAARRESIWHDDSRPVLDTTLSKTQLLALARQEAVRAPDRVQALMLDWRTGAWRDLRWWITIGLLIGLAFHLVLGFRPTRIATLCTGCGTVVCAHCLESEPAQLCGSCAQVRPRVPLRMAVPEGPPPPQRRRVSLATGRFVAPLFPGAADVAYESPLRATVAIAVAWLGLLAGAALVGAAERRTADWTASVDAPLLAGALVVVLAAWLPGLLQARRHAVSAPVGARSVQRGA